MADEPVVEPQVEAPAEPQVETPEPHPLEEGGVRFNEVYARMKAAEEREREKDQRIARLEGQFQAIQRPPQPQQQFTVEQVADFLQQKVDRGEMTPMRAAAELSGFRAQQISQQNLLQAEQIRSMAAVQNEALAEVNRYIEKVPALNDPSSAEFRKAQDAANRVSRRLGLPVTDFRVQQTALESVYGSVDKIAQQGQQRQQARDASLPHVETGGGRTVAPQQNGKQETGLEGVSPKYIEYWKKRGYSHEQMVQEAKYVTKEPRQVPSRAR